MANQKREALLESALRSILMTIGPAPMTQTEKDVVSIVSKALTISAWHELYAELGEQQ